jgi:hypothetical protein
MSYYKKAPIHPRPNPEDADSTSLEANYFHYFTPTAFPSSDV